MKCRHCSKELKHTFIDLGLAPPSNSFKTEETITKPEKRYPLRVLICDGCWLVQTEDFIGATELFSADYPYFSSFSSSWLKHAKSYVEKMTSLFNLTNESTVVEIAANDGYLLQYVKQRGISCYGIEPTHSTANAAREKGIEIIEEFFGVPLAGKLVKQGRAADLLIANNVLAHVPDINDFVTGCSLLLNPDGVASFEFPHLLNLVEQNQFDTIYHEHYSYFSLVALLTIFEANNLNIFHVEELPTHGGSLRVFATRADSDLHPRNKSVKVLLEKEQKAGVNKLGYYQDFQIEAEKIKSTFTQFLLTTKSKDKKVAAYGAAAKGNTLLNYSGIGSDMISFVVDRNPTKQGKYLPGSNIPIVDEYRLKEYSPDYIIILPWNIKSEIIEQLAYIKDWGGRFVTVVPALDIM